MWWSALAGCGRTAVRAPFPIPECRKRPERGTGSRFYGRFSWVCRFRGRLRAWLGRQQLGQPYQIVGCGVQCERPADAPGAAVLGLAQTAGGLLPAKDLFHALTDALADGITGMS